MSDSNETTPATEQEATPQKTEAEESLLGEAPAEGEQKTQADSLLGEKPAEADDAGESPAEPEFDLTPVESEKLSELVPEGFEADPDALQSFAELVNSAASREDIVRGGLELLAAEQAKSEEALVEEWTKVQNAWREEVRNDPDVGGENFETSLAKARTVIETYAPDAKALKELFATSGAGNSIHMVKFLNAIADALPGDAKPVEGTPQPVTKSQAERLFG